MRDQGAADIDKRLKQMDTQVAELSNRKYEGYWQNKSTGTKILGALSMALGAYAQSQGAGPNHAMSIINKAMDDDFNIFKDTTQNKIAAINKSKLGIDTKRNMIADAIVGVQAKKLSDIRVIQNKIEDLANRFSNPTTKAKLDIINAQLDQKAALARGQFEESMAKQADANIRQQLAQAPLNLTPGQKKVDESYAKDYNTFTATGRNNAANTIDKLVELQKEVAADTGFGEAGGTRLPIPDMLRSRLAIERRDDARNFANKTLKELFGGQLSDGEREAAAREFWNDDLDNKSNAKRLAGKIQELKDNLVSQTAKAQYYEDNGTLQGFKGGSSSTSSSSSTPSSPVTHGKDLP
jgi:hypothetical protein